jgi:hypothetical protein
MWNSLVCDGCKIAAMSLHDVAKLADSLVTLSDIPWYLIAYFFFSLTKLSASLSFLV